MKDVPPPVRTNKAQSSPALVQTPNRSRSPGDAPRVLARSAPKLEVVHDGSRRRVVRSTLDSLRSTC